MNGVAASNLISKAPRLLVRASSCRILKRQVNVNHALKSPRRVTQTQASQQSTIAMPSIFQKSSAETLSWQQIQSVLMSAAIPMVGFGFMDNFVMIQAGGYIDSTLGVQFGLATLTAAAMGQVVSDVSGVLFGGSLERILSPFIKQVKLSTAQQRLPAVARLRLAGAVGGVIVGCILGASSLYFVLDDDSSKPLDRLRQLQGIVGDMLQEMHDVSLCTMHVKKAAHALSSTQRVAVVKWSEESKASQCAEQKDIVIGDGRLYLPVLNGEQVVAVMELEGTFSQEQEQNLKRISRHVGIFMNRMLTDE
jgi:hypothetical protein